MNGDQDGKARRCPQILPLSRVTFTSLPRSEYKAVAPSATTSLGWIRRSSVASHQAQALVSPTFGLAWMRRLPRGVNLKCLSAFVT